MKYIKLFFPSLFFCLLFVGCSNDTDDSDDSVEQQEEVKLVSGIDYTIETESMTRAETYVAFDAGVKLKIIVRDNNDPSKFVTNGEKTTEATTGAKNATDNSLTCSPVFYWNDLGGVNANLKLIGIHPFVADNSITNDKITWTVEDDQTEGLAAKDLMFALASSYTYSEKSTPASLKFKHALTKISITLKPNEHFALNKLDDAEVAYKGVPTQADFTITTGSSEDPTTSSSVAPFKATVKDAQNDPAAYSFTILAVPHSVTTSDVIATVSLDGNTYNIKPKTGRSFNAGEHTNFNVTISKTGVNAEASVVDWNKLEDINLDDTRLVGLGDFTIDAPNTVTIEEGAIVNMRFTDKGNGAHDAVFEYTKQSESSYKWEATTPVYWDDIDRAITKVEALLVTKPVSDYTVNANGEYYFTGSVSGQELTWNSSPTITLGSSEAPFFKRPVSKIDITIKTSTGDDKVDITGIKTGGVVIPECGGININDKVTIVKNGTDNLTITGDHNSEVTEHTCVTAYIAPQSLNELCHVTIGANVYKVELTDEKKKFDAGKHYTFTVTIKKTGITFTSSLKDWETVDGGDIPTEL